MPRKLTKSQAQIVHTLHAPLFVAAGAGSGKSSTLAERIAYALSEESGPYLNSIDEALIITFTSKAADEIKEKIRSLLYEKGLDEHAMMVDAAWISTIHGMCSRILRTHAIDLGIDPKFELISSYSASKYREMAIQEVLQTIEDDPSYAILRHEWPLFASDNGFSTTESIQSIMLDLIEASANTLDGINSIVCRGRRKDFNKSAAALFSTCQEVIALLKDKIATAKTPEKIEVEIEILTAEMEAVEAFAGVKPPAVSNHDILHILDTIPEKHGDVYRAKDVKQFKIDLRDFEGQLKLAAWTQIEPDLMKTFLHLATKVDKRYAELKKSKGLLDNNDLILKVYKALREHPELEQYYGHKFKLVMIDEFQDTNYQQVELISKLAGEGAIHLTTVGDAQQSIYRFRGADVDVFKKLQEQAQPIDSGIEDGHAALVTMDMNFRSHAEILKFVETVCNTSVLPESMPLKPNPGFESKFNDRDLPRIDVELLYNSTTQLPADIESASFYASRPKPLDIECQMVVSRIDEYRQHGVKDKDIAILLPNKNYFGPFISELQSRNIPYVVSGGTTFAEAPEVLLVKTILLYLANPLDSENALYPLLESGLFNLTSEDFLTISTYFNESRQAVEKHGVARGFFNPEFDLIAKPSDRLIHARAVLMRAIRRLKTWPVDKVIREVLVDSGWVARREREGVDGEAEVGNAFASTYIINDIQVKDFLGLSLLPDAFETWLTIEKQGPVALAGDSEGAIQIMTIHASKGLEFPVVAIAGCWGSTPSAPSAFTSINTDGSLYANIIPKFLKNIPAESDPNEDWMSEEVDIPDDLFSNEAYQTRNYAEWGRYLYQLDLRGAQAEKSRLLYVGLTRAKEALIIGMSVSKNKENVLTPELADKTIHTLSLEELAPGEYTFDYGGVQDGRIRVAQTGRLKKGAVEDKVALIAAGNSFEFSIHEDNRDDVELALFVDLPDKAPLSALVDARTAHMRDDFYSYSKMKRIDDQCSESDVADKDRSVYKFKTVEFESLDDDFDDTIEEMSAVDYSDADRATNLGSAFHMLAEAMVNSADEVSEEQLSIMADNWELTPRQKARLLKALMLWSQSAIRKEALSYDSLYAEYPFCVQNKSKYGEYLEGAIDLLCTNINSKNVLLIDYKTGDRTGDSNELRKRHQRQAEVYAHVLMKMGFVSITCSFVIVEREDGNGEPLVISYEFVNDESA